MSIKKKLPLIFTILVFFILFANNTFHYLRSKEALLDFNEKEIKLITQEISFQVENAKEGSLYVENLLGKELRTASIAIQKTLPADYNDVTNEQLEQLAKELMVSHITLMAKTKDDVIGVKSSDPKEINLSTKGWGYWYDAYLQLLELKPVRVNEGLTLPNYWSGPIEVASSNPDHVDKWGYYFDGTTNYIIDPYLRDNEVLGYEEQFGPGKVMDRFTKELEGVLELTVFNPKSFGKKKSVVTLNGNSYTRISEEPIWYGKYNFINEKEDAEWIKKASTTGEIQTYSAHLNGKEVRKTFVPINKGNDDQYVIGLVYDYGLIQNQLMRELGDHVLLSSVFMIIVLLTSFVFSRSITNPIGQIVEHVNEIAQGNFGRKLFLKRKDEFGVLTQNVNALSSYLQTYVNDLKHSQTIIEYQALHDPLTSLPNRRFLQDKLKEFLDISERTNENISILFFDLDRFKNVNDSLGHSKGDELLKMVSKRIEGLLALENSVITRQGGDEFIILIKGLCLNEVKQIAEKIVHELKQPFYLDQNEIYLGISCGISVSPDHGKDIDTLIASSDIAMYASKNMGGNRVVIFNEELNKITREKPLIESRLRKAIEEENIKVFYQPKVNGNSGKIVGVEALVRWNDRELGFIPPSIFIPIAEETGLIQPLWEMTMKKACTQIQLWNKNRVEPLKLSVNFSARQFLDPEKLAAQVKEILQDSQLESKYFEIEITESTLLTNSKEVIFALENLKEHGVSVSIDDFGTGYSSLSYLKSLPIDTLKIDKSFVQEIHSDFSNSEIVEAIINLARSLRLKVVAEGVEEDYQKQYLLQKDCTLMQGFLFSKPLPAEELEKLL
ncbi:putative bifunctional diguanylate cyclase/phosphodiesterase [Neobacillus sp. D3-1R]|uniref:putative bifunctional diguanylate cyclase/phosphodiesterase n=1 Tax=Neobacillus sp. D3-1R TaxID=3445778 RepID=UPI003F9FDA49